MTTITLPRAVVEQALGALEAYGSHVPNCDHLVLLTSLPPQRKPCSCGLRANITALRAALAQQVEPVCRDCYGVGYDASGQLCGCQDNPSF